MSITWVADIGSNHNRSLNRCFKLIDAAKDAGCDTVKFQLFKADLWCGESMGSSVLPVEWIPTINDYCRKVKIGLACTPVYLEAVDLLEPYVDYFKIGSYEVLWTELIQKCIDTGKPLVISLGLAKIENIRNILAMTSDYNNITFLHCQSEYPVPPERAALKRIAPLKNMYPVNIGYSDHSAEPGVMFMAATMKPSMVEFHLDLDGKGNEFHHGHCWLPQDIKRVIYDVNIMEKANNFSIVNSKFRNQMTDPSDGRRPLKEFR
jgi:N-acetylneuraminate synthase